MSNITFLLTLFPTFSLHEPHVLSLEDLEFLLEQNLSGRDLIAANQIWLLGDSENVRSFLKGEPMNHTGSIDPEKLASMIISGEKLPSWLAKFFKDIPEEQRAEKSHLLSRYLLQAILQTVSQKAVRKVLTLEYDMRSVLEYARAQALSLPFLTEVEFLKKPSQEWPEAYQELLSLWNKHKDDPVKLEQHLAEWRFTILESWREQASNFSLSRLIFSLAIFQFIESRRPLKDGTKNILQERIIRTLVQ